MVARRIAEYAPLRVAFLAHKAARLGMLARPPRPIARPAAFVERETIAPVLLFAPLKNISPQATRRLAPDVAYRANVRIGARSVARLNTRKVAAPAAPYAPALPETAACDRQTFLGTARFLRSDAAAASHDRPAVSLSMVRVRVSAAHSRRVLRPFKHLNSARVRTYAPLEAILKFDFLDFFPIFYFFYIAVVAAFKPIASPTPFP